MSNANPTCRDCEVDAENVQLFIDKAGEHNDDPMESMYIGPVTVAFSGNNYDPSNNTFLCPPCKKTREDEGRDLYDTDTDD